MNQPKDSKTNPLSLFQDILNLDPSKSTVTVCLAGVKRENDQPVYRRLQLSDEITNEFRSVVESLIENYTKEIDKGDLQLRKYDPGSKPDMHEIEYLELSSHKFVEEQIDSLSSVNQISVFSLDDEFVASLRFSVIIVQPDRGKPINFFRIYSSMKELKRSKVFAAVLSDGQFDTIEQPVFLFDRFIDCFSRGNHMFIRSTDKFQKIFRYFKLVQKNAEKVLEKIQKHIAILGFDEFADSCKGHLQKLAKLNNIAGKPYLNKVKIIDMKKVINKHNLPVKITKKDGKEMIEYDASDKWAILRLLDDDYLDSLMTGQGYEVTGKRPLE